MAIVSIRSADQSFANVNVILRRIITFLLEFKYIYLL